MRSVVIIILNLIAAVEILYFKLYDLFSKELLNLNIGYSHNESVLSEMMDIVNAIDYINHGNPSKADIIKIIKRYE